MLADMGCRNTVFNAAAQSGLPYLPQLVGAGYGCFRRAAGEGDAWGRPAAGPLALSTLPHTVPLALASQPACPTPTLCLCRVELVDEPAEAVGPLLEGYRQALQAACTGGGSQQAQAMWQWMQGLPDANGRAHGVGLGSLEVRAERGSAGMKPTAASLR